MLGVTFENDTKQTIIVLGTREREKVLHHVENFERKHVGIETNRDQAQVFWLNGHCVGVMGT